MESVGRLGRLLCGRVVCFGLVDFCHGVSPRGALCDSSERCAVAYSAEPPGHCCNRASTRAAPADAPEFSIQRFLMGARTNFAHTAAAIDITAAEINTVLQPPLADRSDAIGTSIEAVPFAV